MMPNIAVLAPMPRASVTMTMPVKSGLFASNRLPERTSRQRWAHHMIISIGFRLIGKPALPAKTPAWIYLQDLNAAARSQLLRSCCQIRISHKASSLIRPAVLPGKLSEWFKSACPAAFSRIMPPLESGQSERLRGLDFVTHCFSLSVQRI